MAEHIPSSQATKSAMQLGAKYKYDGKTYILTGFHPRVLVMKDSDGKWYDAVQYVAADGAPVTQTVQVDGEDAEITQEMVFLRRATDFAENFERVV